MCESNTIRCAEEYVRMLFRSELPPSRWFHNLKHTTNVVQSVDEISIAQDIAGSDREDLILAAWFHDTGYIMSYRGHERKSQDLAAGFLQKVGYDQKKTWDVLELIGATTMPQNPNNELQKVICDADLQHLSLPNYCEIQRLLRAEWADVLNESFSDQDWHILNIAFLENHQYFTPYGRNVLGPRKKRNILRCKGQLVDMRVPEISRV